MRCRSEMPERWIVMARWDEFQHRDMARSTVPPWIKNHTKLLHDENYRGLSPTQRGVLHGLWLEYAASRRQLPDNTATVSRRLGHRVLRRTLEALNHAGFIEFSAVKPAGAHASLEVEVEKKEELRSSTNTGVVDKPRRYAQLLAAGRKYANDWNSGTSEAFDTGLDELEQLTGARLKAGDRYRLWDQALHHG